MFGVIFKTALDNPVSYGLLDQSQMCFGEESATFLSNLSLLGDLLYSCCDAAYWSGFYEQFESAEAGQLAKRSESTRFLESKGQYADNLKHQLAELRQYFLENVSPSLLQIRMEDLVFDQSSKELQAILSAFSDVRENQLCGGYWGGSAAYFLDIAEEFMGDVDYLKKNLQILQRNCADVLTQVYKQDMGQDAIPTGQSRNHSISEDNPKMRNTLFADDLKFELYNNALIDLERVANYLSSGAGKNCITQFKAMVHARQQVYSGIVVIPLGNELITEQKAYIGQN